MLDCRRHTRGLRHLRQSVASLAMPGLLINQPMGKGHHGWFHTTLMMSGGQSPTWIVSDIKSAMPMKTYTKAPDVGPQH